MKRLITIAIVVVLTLGVVLSGNCYAGNEGWAAAGGFLGGLIVGSAASSRPYYYGRPAYYYSDCYSYPVYGYSTYGGRCYYPRYYNRYPRYYNRGYTTYNPYYYNDYWY